METDDLPASARTATEKRDLDEKHAVILALLHEECPGCEVRSVLWNGLYGVGVIGPGISRAWIVERL